MIGQSPITNPLFLDERHVVIPQQAVDFGLEHVAGDLLLPQGTQDVGAAQIVLDFVLDGGRGDGRFSRINFVWKQYRSKNLKTLY